MESRHLLHVLEFFFTPTSQRSRPPGQGGSGAASKSQVQVRVKLSFNKGFFFSSFF